jgi:tetratricopeptide (TPR) repeat protein
MERAPTTPLTGDVAREVAARTNAKAILRGRLARAGSGYAVSLELADAGGSTILASMQGSAGDAQELIPVVDHLTRKLRGKIGEGLRQVARTVPLERATTASLEALRKFTEATQANDVEFNYDRAVAAGREAVRIDSTFALAWRKLAVALQNAGGSAAAIDSALERAAQFAEKLPPRERHLVMGGYYETHTIRNNRALALNEYRAVFGIDSLNSVAINQLAMLHSFRGDLDSALHYGRYYYRVRQGPNIRFRAVYGLVALGHVDSARSLLDSMRADDPAWIGSFAGSRMVRVVEYSSGNIEAVRASIAQSLQSPVLPLRLDALLHGAEVELVGGHLDSATALNRAAQELQLARGMPGFPSLAAAQADILYRDRAVVGIASLDSFVASGEWTAALKADRPYATVALLYALAGAPAKARQILAQYRIELPGVAESELSRGNTVTVEALIAIAEGRLPEAITLGRSILRERDGSAPPCRVCGPLALANAFDRMGQLDSATAWYEEYLRVPTIVRFFSGNDAYWLAKVRKRLGELYDQRGERAKAIEQYAALVEQWKDADAELQPAVASVRARLNELRGQEGT